jgi:hypothetical protein
VEEFSGLLRRGMAGRPRMIGLSGATALAVFAFAAAGAASAGAETGTCTEMSAKIKLSPGLTATPMVQTISIKGTLTGCTGSTVTGAKFVAHMKTAEPVSCSVLKGPGAVELESSIVIKWSPKIKGQGSSMGTFSMPLTENPAGVSFGGPLESGPFSSDSISGTAPQTYTGGPTCGEATGKKKAKAVKSAESTTKSNGSLTQY